MAAMEPDWRVALESVIRREAPAVEAVDFDDDGEHVYLLLDDDEGGHWLRFRLDAAARQLVLGEFPTVPAGMMLVLHPPRGEEGED